MKAKKVTKKAIKKPIDTNKAAKKATLTKKTATKPKLIFPFTIPILYEDEHCLAINKPAGVVVHPDGKAPGPFLTDWILANYPQTKNVGESILQTDGGVIERPGIVHRIDRETSGVLLIAKTAAGHAWLKEQFQNRTITKKYLAFVYGSLNDQYGMIDMPIGRSRGDFRRWNAERNSRGEMRPAMTQYVVLGAIDQSRNYEANAKKGSDGRGGATIGPADMTKRFTFIEAEPKTGRTHQIRVHFKAIQHPIVGDSLYAESRVQAQPNALGFKRMALHAYSISFDKVGSGQITVVAPVPEDFVHAMKIFGLDPAITLDPNKLKMLPKVRG